MFDKIDLKDAVRRAMQTEKNAMDFYLRGAEMMKNAEAKKVFALLAREESEHAEWFYNVYPGDDIADLQEFLKSGADQDSEWMTELTQLNAAGFDERKAMELAMDKEKKLAEHLRALAEKIEDPKVREIFEQNATSTDHHYQIIESEYARLMGMVHESDMDTFVRE
ncbi:MAG: ferritin family protein [Desulfuromonadales bacterium]|nr:ferritin family protein [Desulfuromonadales bacterium]